MITIDHIIHSYAFLLEQGIFTLDDLALRIDEVYCNYRAQYFAEYLRGYTGIIEKTWRSGILWTAERRIFTTCDSRNSYLTIV